LATNPGNSLSGQSRRGGISLPRGRRERGSTRAAVGRSTSSPGPSPRGLETAALVAILAAAASAAIFFVFAWLFDISPAVGVIGSVVCSTVSWWWVSGAAESSGGG
jgi:hypothetical protein